MSNAPFALSTLAPPSLSESEYDAIFATVMGSERGRWFLNEFSRRNRHTDTVQVIAAIARIESIFSTAERIKDVVRAMRERRFDPTTCDQIEGLASAILNASALRKPGDRRAEKLADALVYLEHRIAAMIANVASAAPHEIAATEAAAELVHVEDRAALTEAAVAPRTDQQDTNHDPLAALKALSDEERIALCT
jgi:hypothetical protein